MSMLIRWRGGAATASADPFVSIADDEPAPDGDVMISFARFQAEGDVLLSQDRRVGVRVEPEDAVEALAYDLPRIAVVALVFPKFRDGRPYSTAMVLRTRLGFTGELRAVGDVLLEQAPFMIRCGFDAFEPADGTDASRWGRAARRFRHVYQRAADDREPAFVARLAYREPAFLARLAS
jgi:uncharacterized protein (DUF934 family)